MLLFSLLIVYEYMNQESIEIEYEADMVSFEEKEVILGPESLLTRMARAVFYLFLVLMPLWFLPASVLPVEINKGYFASIMVIFSLLFALGGMLQEGRARFVSSRFFFLAVLFLLVILASSLFSRNAFLSLWGVGSEPITFAHMLVALGALFLAPLLLREPEQVKKAFFSLAISLGAAFVFFFVHSVLNISFLPASWSFAQNRSFNPFGSWNALAMFFGLGVVIFLPMFSLKRYAAVVWFGAMILGVLFTNFTSVWLGIGVIALFFVALLLSQRNQHSQTFAIALFLLLFSVFFILLGDALGQFFANRYEALGRPLEAFPDVSTSFTIGKKALQDSPLLGSGPNTFGLLWDRFKNPAINLSALWQVRFTTGASTFLTLIAETGILGAISFLLLVLFFVRSGVRALGSGGNAVRVSFAAAFYLLLMWFFYPLNFALILLTFLLIGVFYAAAGQAEIVSAFDMPLFETKERGFVFSLIIIFLLVGGVTGAYFETTRYWGELAFARGLDIYNKDGSINAAEKEINTAVSFSRYQDRYYRALAQLEYLKVQRAINDRSLAQDERTTRFQNAYNAALRFAREAYDLNKSDSANSRILGQVHELAIPVDPDRSGLAIESYTKAHDLNPADPTILTDIARVYLSKADVIILRGGGSTSQRLAADERAKAVGYLEKAIELKPDYAQANFTLSQLYALQGQLDQAIAKSEQTVRLVPNDIGALFQLGLLYYQKQRLDDARVLFESAVRITPSYSNARYFLGIIYDRQGRKAEGIEQFKQIAALNPDNKDIGRIITALEAGKKIDDVIGQPPPEQRRDTPVQETKPPQEVPAP